jgi:hypothetical protein
LVLRGNDIGVAISLIERVNARSHTDGVVRIENLETLFSNASVSMVGGSSVLIS